MGHECGKVMSIDYMNRNLIIDIVFQATPVIRQTFSVDFFVPSSYNDSCILDFRRCTRSFKTLAQRIIAKLFLLTPFLISSFFHCRS